MCLCIFSCRLFEEKVEVEMEFEDAFKLTLTFLSTEEKSQANLIKHLKMQYLKGAP